MFSLHCSLHCSLPHCSTARPPTAPPPRFSHQRDEAGWYPAGPDAAPYKWTRTVSGKLLAEKPFQASGR